jgi:hypothetical protein
VSSIVVVIPLLASCLAFAKEESAVSLSSLVLDAEGG